MGTGPCDTYMIRAVIHSTSITCGVDADDNDNDADDDADVGLVSG